MALLCEGQAVDVAFAMSGITVIDVYGHECRAAETRWQSPDSSPNDTSHAAGMTTVSFGEMRAFSRIKSQQHERGRDNRMQQSRLGFTGQT